MDAWSLVEVTLLTLDQVSPLFFAPLKESRLPIAKSTLGWNPINVISKVLKRENILLWTWMTKGDCKINGSISQKKYRALFLCFGRLVLSKVDNTCTTYSIIVTSPSVCGIRTFYGASLSFITILSLTYHTCTFFW